MIKIGLFGAEISNVNKGVSALAMVQIAIIKEILDEEDIEYSFVLFSNEKEDVLKQTCDELNLKREKIENLSVSYRKLSDWFRLSKKIDSLDYAIDITGGDSFSDIYGLKLFFRSCIHKLMIIFKKIPFMLAPQTYGPFNNWLSKLLAYYIIERGTIVISRDKISYDHMPKHIKKKMLIGTDIAFALPYNPNIQKSISNDVINVGINISQLLCSGMFFGKNGINLELDYVQYINDLLEFLKEQNNYKVHLIPHVAEETKNNLINFENDCVANTIFAQKYPDVINAPCFKSPVEAKNYISGMDIFIGSRMHATIAAFSAGVATIPVAYSRKFKGVFSNLRYDYVIDAETQSNEDALNLTKKYLKNYIELRSAVLAANGSIQLNLETVKEAYKRFLLSK